jgi:hypothetical protein
LGRESADVLTMRRMATATTRVAPVHHRVDGIGTAAAVLKATSCSVMSLGADRASILAADGADSRTSCVWGAGSTSSTRFGGGAVGSAGISGFLALVLSNSSGFALALGH